MNELNILNELLATLESINFTLKGCRVPEAKATLLVAKATTLAALQKYERGEERREYYHES